MSKNNSRSPKSAALHQKTKTSSGNKNSAAALFVSLLSGTAAFFIATFALAFIIEKSPDPNAFLPAAAIICTAISAAVAGGISAKITGKATPWSIFSGLLMLLVYLFLSLFFDPANYENSMAMKSITALLLPIVAYISGTMTAKKRRNAKGKRPR